MQEPKTQACLFQARGKDNSALPSVDTNEESRGKGHAIANSRGTTRTKVLSKNYSGKVKEKSSYLSIHKNQAELAGKG